MTIRVRPPRVALTATLVLASALVLAACSGDSTEGSGSGESGATGATQGTGASGGTGTGGATAATGPTGATPGAAATGVAGGGFDGPVSVDTQGQSAAGITGAFYSCDGVEGTWTYIVKGGPLDFDIESTVDMAGGDGTLVIGDTVEIAGLGSVEFTETVDLEIGGTAEAPTFVANHVKVDVAAPIPGVEELAQALFAEGTEVPIQVGARQC